MENITIAAMITGSATLAAAVATPLTAKVVNKRSLQKTIPKEIRRPIKFDIEGDWKGELQNEYGNSYEMRFEIKKKRESIDGKIIIGSGPNEKELKLDFWGVSPEDRYFCLHYSNINAAAGHFGTVFLYLEPAHPNMVMSGKFLGFGPDNRKPFNGSLKLNKAN